MELLEYRFENKDCLDFLHDLADNSVKLIITSPPYNIGKKYELSTTLDHYLSDMEPIISELYRVLREDGSICWEVGNYIEKPKGGKSEVYPLDIYYYNIFKKYNLHLRNRIIWHFEHGLQCSDRLSGRYESILWFTKSDNYTFNLDAIRIASKYPGKKQYKGEKKGMYSGNILGKNPSDLWKADMYQLLDDWDSLIWNIPNVKNNHCEKVDHPCQFPIELVERCILALTDENDIVLDPFAGVASTIIAALKNFRRGYGTELIPEYVKRGEERIQLLREDKLETRRIGQTVYDPRKSGSLSKYPIEFVKAKLSYLDRIKKQIMQEEEKLKILIENENR